jgi:hypothetical protein
LNFIGGGGQGIKVPGHMGKELGNFIPCCWLFRYFAAFYHVPRLFAGDVSRYNKISFKGEIY